ncbi:hypothetical protein [Lapillicoccus sp.]|nr:hypothetical protein [Lapillicoccus sp.]
MHTPLLEQLAHRRIADRARTRPPTGIRRSARLIQLEIHRARHAGHQ